MRAREKECKSVRLVRALTIRTRRRTPYEDLLKHGTVRPVRRPYHVPEENFMPTRTAGLSHEIRAIRMALQQLQRSLDRLVPALSASGAWGVPAPRRKLKLTPARRAALKLQGQYMGYMRGLGPTQKNKVKRIRDAQGIRAAIAAAKRLSR
jgi:hypothetical protein